MAAERIGPKTVNIMTQASAKERVKQLWRWRTSKNLLIAASAITVVISAFEIKLDPVAMLREIASNFITSASITFITGTVIVAFAVPRLGRSWARVLLLLLLLAIGGMLGGLIGWGINDLLFPYRITHPHVYLLIVALLSIVFGLAVLAYENISTKLNETASRLAEKEIQEQKLLRLKTEAELEALRAKVNPHFLFNTLNSIASLIPEDPGKAEEMVQRLSNLFHYVLSASETSLVPLEEELTFVGEYLEIQKVRLGGRLDYSLEIGSSLDGVVIPSMLLQPLVENSVKYGIAPHKAGGKIEVRCQREGDRCSITIVDTGAGFDTRSVGEGFGIGGVRRRLELNYPGRYRFDITSDNGVTVRIQIPVTNVL
jgi:sensor histidine kinase YesM